MKKTITQYLLKLANNINPDDKLIVIYKPNDTEEIDVIANDTGYELVGMIETAKHYVMESIVMEEG